MSQGQRLLAGCGVSLGDIASAVGTSKQVVSRWRSGQMAPSEDFRRRLESCFGIPREAWTAPGSVVAVSAQSAAETIGPLESLRRVLHDKRCELGISPTEFATLAKAEGEIIERLFRREAVIRGESIAGLRLEACPKWSQFRDEMERALAPYPKALRAVRAVIDEVSAPSGAERGND